jgi:hypothetical protein
VKTTTHPKKMLRLDSEVERDAEPRVGQTERPRSAAHIKETATYTVVGSGWPTNRAHSVHRSASWTKPLNPDER